MTLASAEPSHDVAAEFCLVFLFPLPHLARFLSLRCTTGTNQGKGEIAKTRRDGTTT